MLVRYSRVWRPSLVRHSNFALLCAWLFAVGCGDSKPPSVVSKSDAAADVIDTPVINDNDSDVVGEHQDGGSADTDDGDHPSDGSAADLLTEEVRGIPIDGRPNDEVVDVRPDGNVPESVEVLGGADASPDPDASVLPDGDGIIFTPGPSLQLWLRGDRNVDCLPQGNVNRVSAWRDLSDRGRDARPAVGKLGPLCGPSANQINNNRVVTFPRTTGMEDEEHLEVDLGGLVGTAFTVAIVEQRTGREPLRYMIGSKLPFPESINCGINPNLGKGIVFGYQKTVRLVATTWGDNCDLSYVLPSSTDKPSASFFIFSPTTGLSLFVDGMLQANQPGVGIDQISGLIGRGYERRMEAPDSRYHGDIAEIMVFDTAITDEVREHLESYFRANWGTLP